MIGRFSTIRAVAWGSTRTAGFASLAMNRPEEIRQEILDHQEGRMGRSQTSIPEQTTN